MNFNLKKAASFLFVFSFGLCVIILGIMSFRNLAVYYIKDEPNNNEWTAELGSPLETDIASSFFEQFEFINLNGAFRNLLGQREMNDVIKLNNGYLYRTAEQTSLKELAYWADRVQMLSEYCRSENKVLLFAATPVTDSKYDSQLPIGIKDYANQNIDNFIKLLRARNVDVLDFREEMMSDGIDHYSMMYRTDHHWTTEAGFYAFTKLSDYIIQNTGCTVDSKVLDFNNYEVRKYPKAQLGSYGRRTGIYFGGMDDFDLIIPRFETQITDGSTTATMPYFMINEEALENVGHIPTYLYDTVLGRTNGSYHNLLSQNDIRILLVGDSFSRVVNQYLSIAFSDIHFVYNADVESYTSEKFKEYNPNVIVLLYYSGEMEPGHERAYRYTFLGE